MKVITPNYYSKFSCIADKCRHSCCIGWEIEIDSDTLEYYGTLSGETGEKLAASIADGQFILTPDERCPFLKADGLCELICQLGESSLCQICRDHPRFRSFFSDRTEIGLGLCCEEAARLITQKTDKAQLTVLQDDSVSDEADAQEAALLKLRDNLFAIAQDRDFSVEERTENLLDFCEIALPEMTFCNWSDFLFSLERLDGEWEQKLELLKKAEHFKIAADMQTAFEQLLVYFLFRHVPSALYDGDLDSKICFAVLSVRLLAAIFSQDDSKNLAELARMYSSEIEYSDENLTAIFDKINGEAN